MAVVKVKIKADTVQDDSSIYNPSTLVGVKVGMAIESPFISGSPRNPSDPNGLIDPPVISGFNPSANQIYVNGLVTGTSVQQEMTLTPMVYKSITIQADLDSGDSILSSCSTVDGLIIGMTLQNSPYFGADFQGNAPIISMIDAPNKRIQISNMSYVTGNADHYSQVDFQFDGQVPEDTGATSTGITWPESLPQFMNQDGYSYAFGDTTIRSDVDVGLAKVRARTTRAVDKIAFTQDLTVAQFATLKTFYKTDTNGGTQKFNLPDPITQSMISVRFSKPPSFTPQGGIIFRVSIEVEVMP